MNDNDNYCAVFDKICELIDKVKEIDTSKWMAMALAFGLPSIAVVKMKENNKPQEITVQDDDWEQIE